MSIEWSIDISGPCVTNYLCCSVNPLSGRRGKGNEDEANPVGVIFFLAYLGGLSFFSFFILFFLFLFSSESAYGRMPLLDLAFCGSGLRQQLVFVPIPAHDTMQDC